jgi:magnesium chelatase family protein
MQIQRYVSKISGPLLDRIDIHIDVPAVKFKERASDTPAESSAEIRDRVVRARRVQLERFTTDIAQHSKPRLGSPTALLRRQDHLLATSAS